MSDKTKLLLTVLVIILVVLLNYWWFNLISASDLPDWLKWMLLRGEVAV